MELERKVTSNAAAPAQCGAAAVYTLTNSSCRWPIGEPGTREFHFCGDRSSDTSPYCKAHYEMSLRS
ncbi:MAG: GcrA family cell cycle regulator [Pseudomonadota bacterium]